MLVLWRYDQKKVRFTWLQARWSKKDSAISEREFLLEMEAHIKGTGKLEHQATLNSLVCFVILFLSLVGDGVVLCGFDLTL